MPRFFRHILTLAAVVLFGFAPLAQAEVPKAGSQVPGYYRLQLGQFEITALYDGAIENWTPSCSETPRPPT